METRSRTSRYALVLAALGAAGVVGASAHDVADALGAPTGVIAGIAAATGLGAIVAAVATYHQSQNAEVRAEAKKKADEERDVVTGLLAFLEDRRLLTDDTGYQSHFPDHLRQSAEEIRSRTNDALQATSRDSPLVPILKQIQTGARRFQEATEGAMDGERAGGGMSPFVPMGMAPYLRALADYREEMALGMKAAANLHGTELDSAFWVPYQRGQSELRKLAQYFDEMRREQVQERRNPS